MTRLLKRALWFAAVAACFVHGMSARESVAALLGNDFSGTLYDVDPTTGAASNPRGGALFGLAGITCGSPNGTLYGVTASLMGLSKLVTLDPVTGTSTIVGSTGLSGLLEGDLDFDPTSGTLYGILGTGNTLFTLNTTTGAATIVGPLTYPGIVDPSAMAFDSAGMLYVFDGTGGVLAKINKTNAATISTVTLTPSLPVLTLSGMDFDPASGALYVGIGFASGGPNALYTLDVATGAMVLIGATGADIAGLAFCRSCLLSSDFTGAIQNVDQFTGVQTNSRGGPTSGLAGITYSAATGTLYGVTASLSSGSTLVTIDPVTGLSTVVGSTSLMNLLEGDLDIDPTTGTLYGMYGFLDTLLTFNTTTGAASVVGPMSGSSDPSAMAFDAGGNLYVLDGTAGTLKRINKTNATTISTVTVTPSLPIHTLEAMDFDPGTGVLYVGIGMAAGGANALYTLDPGTGTLTTIGPTGEIAGLTFGPAALCVSGPPPPPCTGGVDLTKPRLKLGKLLAPAGDDQLQAQGTLNFTGTSLPLGALNLHSAGMRVEIVDLGLNGAAILNQVLPGGLVPNPCGPKDGWTVNGPLTSAKFATKTASVPPGCVPGSAGGIVQAQAKDQTFKAKGAAFKINGRNGSYAPAVGPFRMTVVLGDSTAELNGQCATHTFAVDACKPNKTGTSIKCK